MMHAWGSRSLHAPLEPCSHVCVCALHACATHLRSCADESIDEIAAFLGVGEQVAALTAK